MKCPDCGGELKCWGECESGAMHYQCYKCKYEIHTIAEKWEKRAEKAEAECKKVWEFFVKEMSQLGYLDCGLSIFNCPLPYGECTYETCPIVAKAKEGLNGNHM